MPDVADEIRPADAVGGFDEPGVSDGPEGLADVGGVGDVAVGAEEDGAQAGGIGCVADVGVGGFAGAGDGEGTGEEEIGKSEDLRPVIERFHEAVFVVNDLLQLVGELFAREGRVGWWRPPLDGGVGIIGTGHHAVVGGLRGSEYELQRN